MTRILRSFIGADASGDMAWRVTKPGYDALTETNEDHFIFNSDWARAGLIHDTGEVGPDTYVYFDALPFVPHVLVFRRDGALLNSNEQARYDYSFTVAGPVTAYVPVDIRSDRFKLVAIPNCPTPLVFPYIVFKVPVIGA